MEVWKKIEGYGGNYEVSNYGRVRSIKRIIVYSNGARRAYPERYLKYHYNQKGYIQVYISHKSKCYLLAVHRLVAKHFVLNIYDKPQVNHKDLNKKNNHHENLEWVTCKENIIHSHKNGAHDERNKKTILNIKKMRKHYEQS